MREFFATAAKGTEPALRDELREHEFHGVRAERGGVRFTGDWPEGWRCCLWSRVAMTVLAPLTEYDAPSAEALYEGARALDWSCCLTSRHTFSVRAVCRSSRLRHSGFIALKVKDAIADAIRDRYGARPNVARHDPDVSVFVRLVEDRATIALDLAGEPLFRRGYRREVGPAPLKETLAAAVIRFSGWDRLAPLLDPFCGSGVIPIEAALWAGRRAPGLGRPRFGFERWASHDASCRERMKALREAALAAATEIPADIVAGDLSEEAVSAARANARRAGVRLRWYRGSFDHMPRLDRPGFIVANPPYGRRLAVADDFYEQLARALHRRRRDTLAILSANPGCTRPFPLRPDRTWTLYNGPIECRLLCYRGRERNDPPPDRWDDDRRE
jgi:putative N6-adenine-specific DNA methylase